MFVFDLLSSDKIDNSVLERASHELWLKGIRTYIHRYEIGIAIEDIDKHIFFNVLLDWKIKKLVLYEEREYGDVVYNFFN